MSSSRHRISRAALAAAAAVSIAVVPVVSATANAAPARPTVVLVHGAFADPSSWNAVAQQLRDAGYTVVAPANPLRGLASDADAIADVLNGIDGPIVLAGHSYGGAVISQAAAGNPKVKALVYIAAFMPDAGENLGLLTARFPTLLPIALRPALAEGGIDLTIDKGLFRQFFAADLPVERTTQMAEDQHPVSATAFVSTPTAAAWRTIPSWAMVATEDQTLGPALERFEAQRAGSHTVEVAGSHVVMISHPAEVTDLIEGAADATD
ncbi:alpha/beta fold hydrolase [Nocardia jejuensis]|uniref:alpha/beta fold hydrolase n=1 Tax=Nocardia jejuensis TaxID=328049 RepID=UPI000837602D|nr:alpha/beta hydrolase [Nocardia jejuensis]